MYNSLSEPMSKIQTDQSDIALAEELLKKSKRSYPEDSDNEFSVEWIDTDCVGRCFTGL
jgi:hypothetical protein